MKIPTTPQELFDYLEGERARFRDVLKDLDRDTLEFTTATIRERRSFFQNVAIAAATILGLSSIFSSFPGSTIVLPYLITAVIFYSCAICLVFIFMRFSLDKEQKDIVEVRDDYSSLLKEHTSHVEKYFVPALRAISLDEVKEIMLKYNEELESLPSAKKLKSETELSDTAKKLRQSGADQLEFYGELITFLFCTGTFYIILAICGQQLDWEWGVVGVSAIFLATFTEILHIILMRFFGLLTYLKFGRSRS